jgi:hypothetical protein
MRRIKYIFLGTYIPIPSLAAHKLQCETGLATLSLVHALVHPHAPRVRSPPPVAPAPLSCPSTPTTSPTTTSLLFLNPVRSPTAQPVPPSSCLGAAVSPRWMDRPPTSQKNGTGRANSRLLLHVRLQAGACETGVTGTAHLVRWRRCLVHVSPAHVDARYGSFPEPSPLLIPWQAPWKRIFSFR